MCVYRELSMNQRQAAFTTIELLITVSVLFIIISIALPNFQRQIANNRSVGIAEEFTGALSFARSEALKRVAPVTLCPANDTQTGCGTDWKKGLLVIVDAAATEITKPPVIASSDAILRVWEADPNRSISIVPNTQTFIRYNGLGALARTEGAVPTVMNISAHKCTGSAKREVTVSLSGMLTTRSVACSI